MNYDDMTIVELKNLVRERGIKGCSVLPKQDIIERLKEFDKARQPKEESAVKVNDGQRQPVRRPQEATYRQQRPMSNNGPREMQERQMNRRMPERTMQERPVQERTMPERQMQERSVDRPVQSRPYERNDRVVERPVERDRSERLQVKAYKMGFAPETPELKELDSGIEKKGILEIMPEGYGFIRCDNFLPGEEDTYVAGSFIKEFGLRSGDMLCGNLKVKVPTEKFTPLLYIKTVNDIPVVEAVKRIKFENLTPIFPNERIHLERPGSSVAMRMVDLIAPIGKGQRGMIVSQPKSGKTTLLKEIANSITTNNPQMNLIILLIDERPEEVTDIKESITGKNVEVIYSTFDELPENHKRVSEMVIERAKRLVEHGKDVVILLDSITRLARAYNLTCVSSGRTLSGGLDPAALHMPKKFFGAARNMREGGSLTILATALVDTGSRMDDVVFEEFKGTGNMELVLDRNLSERRIFPAIDLQKSGTRRDDLLLSPDEQQANSKIRRALNGSHAEDAVERLISICAATHSNKEFVNNILKNNI